MLVIPLLYWRIAQFSAYVSSCYIRFDRSHCCHSFVRSSLKILVMLMMPSVGAMAMTLMDIDYELVVSSPPCLFGDVWYFGSQIMFTIVVVYYDFCRLNLLTVGKDHHHMIATAVIVVGVVAEFLGTQTIAVSLILVVLS